MKRVFVTAFVVVGAVGAGIFAAGGGGDSNADGKTYWVQLDNAFGLVEGADLKVGGVKAGKIAGFEVDRTARKAKVRSRSPSRASTRSAPTSSASPSRSR